MKRALLSTYDKTGVVEFAKRLSELGYDIISTGGTYKALCDASVKVINISDVTGFPECLDGRLKTLHPNIHGGILAMRDNAEHIAQLGQLGIGTIDLVVVNLYPFKETISRDGVTLEEAIENIDIGGPTMLRAAAKNYGDVTVITDPRDYERVLGELDNGGVTRETRFYLASKVFMHTAHYDSMIAEYLRKQVGGDDRFTDYLTLTYEKVQPMRYGENPHQSAAFYKEPLAAKGQLTSAVQLHGKELSFNNINDLHGALELLREFDEPAVVACKHSNPCGVGTGNDVYDAYMKAYNCDPTAIFGGIVVANREVDARTAKEMSKIFLEIVLAPSFTEEALAIITKKKNIRIMTLDGVTQKQPSDTLDIKKVSGGILVQGIDNELLPGYKVVTKREPTKKELEDLIFTWKVVKSVKSNGIAIGKDGASVGIGVGQVKRIWACQQAIEHGIENLGQDAVKGCVLASDAFFPFRDCVEAAAAAGITAIIQPGGSVNDNESIEACDKFGIAMIFTQMRHFRH